MNKNNNKNTTGRRSSQIRIGVKVETILGRFRTLSVTIRKQIVVSARPGRAKKTITRSDERRLLRFDIGGGLIDLLKRRLFRGRFGCFRVFDRVENAI